MGSNTEYVYGTPRVYERESDGESVTEYPSAIKINAWPDSGDINVGIIPVDEDGNMQELEGYWTILDEDRAARLIKGLQNMARRVWEPRPW